MRIKRRFLWKVAPLDKERQNRLSRELKIDPLIARLLLNRGIDNTESANHFLNSSLNDLHSPMLMADMDIAVERVIRAITNKEEVVIYGDYDVDGISSTSMLVSFFHGIGLPVSYYIPNRIKEGYGLNNEAITTLVERKFSLMITVDCGVTSFKEVRHAAELGMDVIITDHHQLSEALPPATAIINPARKDCGYPFKNLAGVGIAFKLLDAVRTRLLEKRMIDHHKIPGTKSYLDLVALGTLADMVPLVGENHILVRFGLKQMAKAHNLGLRSLINLRGGDIKKVSATDVGFFIAPRLNAVGRLSNAALGVELLTTSDGNKAKEIARKLDGENSQRRAIQKRILGEVLKRIEKEVDLKNDKAIILASEGWHPGVIGIVASKIVERFNLPTILLNIENSHCRGSARSIPNFHIYNCLNSCRGKLLHFGGHEYAAGLSMEMSMLDDFKSAFQQKASKSLSKNERTISLEIDAEVPLNVFSPDMVDEILDLGPFGSSNPPPVFLCRRVSFIEEPFFVGKNGEHVRFEVGVNGFMLEGIAFGMAEQFKGAKITDGTYDIVFTPMINNYGRFSATIQLKLHDFHPAE
ncbi:MAG: single-stranded-DNA-specific exonuclease RecJ [Nitrospinota bacterium]